MPDGGLVMGVLDERGVSVRVVLTDDVQDAVQGRGGGVALARSGS
jgi:hypothetical protein